MELSRIQSTSSREQHPKPWDTEAPEAVSELCLCTRHETVQWQENEAIFAAFYLCPVITEEHEFMLAAALRSQPRALFSGWDQFLIGNACVGMRWRDDITISEHIPCVPRLLWSDSQFISLKAPLSMVRVLWGRERVWARRGMLLAFMEP